MTFCPFQVNGRDKYAVPLPMTVGEMEDLTKEEAIDIAQSVPDFHKHFGEHAIHSARFTLYPGYKADLDLICPDLEKKKRRKQKTSHRL